MIKGRVKRGVICYEANTRTDIMKLAESLDPTWKNIVPGSEPWQFVVQNQRLLTILTLNLTIFSVQQELNLTF